MTSRSELTGLTALRFFAALFVLLYHSIYFAEGGWLEIPIYGLFYSGWLGVDIFFVLSGFVISYVYAGNLQFGSYLIRRAARIYPVYLVTTLAALLAISVLGKLYPADFGSFDLVMNLLMLQGWYGSSQSSINFVSWTVSAEWSIYLIFPAIIWLIRVLPVNWIGILLPASIFASVGGLAAAGLSEPINKCLFLFCSGVMLFRYWNKNGEFGSWIKLAAVVSVLAMISVEAWSLYFAYTFNGAYLSIFAVFIVAWGINWRTDNPVLLLGGRASYSIYLVHGVVYLVLRKSIELGALNREFGLPLFWFLSISLAYVTYLFLEQPARHWIVNRLLANKTSV